MCQPLDTTAIRESYGLTAADLRGEPLTAWRCALAKALNELEEARAYADKLVDFLPCLPKDLEVLRQANHSFAQRVQDLERDVETLRAQLRVFELEHGGDK
jgi:hypothetical protein